MCGIRSSQTDQQKYSKWPHEITHFHGKERPATSSAKSLNATIRTAVFSK